MKLAYEFRKKALDFAKNTSGINYDSVHIKGIYNEYEVYTPYCKSWKTTAPKIGLPKVILANDNEVKWGNPYDPFSILRVCRKLPSVVFEYDCMCWFGNSYNIKLLSDGTLLKYEYGYSKLGPGDRMRDDSEEVVLINIELVKDIKKLSKKHKEKLKRLPRDLSNYRIMDGANETVRVGRLKFEGANMFREDMGVLVEYYRTHKMTEQEDFIYPLHEFQQIFAELKETINRYCPDMNIWRGFNDEEN